jgi:hypothetical protein
MHASVGYERRRGLAPLAAAGLLVAGLCALRFLFTADEDQSWFLGHTFGSACWFRLHFGIPCPNCGMTRSLILAAHGELARSVSLAAGGAAVVLGAGFASLALGILGVTMLRGRMEEVRKIQNAARVSVLALAAGAGGVWLGAWAVQVIRALRHG